MNAVNNIAGIAIWIASATLALLPAQTWAGEHKEKVLYRFTGQDGSFPKARLIVDANGILYGTTTFGGRNHGIVFELSLNGKETVLYSFRGKHHGDGDFPGGDLIAGNQGELYGVTVFGGFDCGVRFGCGTIFKLTPGGAETVLHTFTGLDGAEPVGGLTIDGQGNLYGTTGAGGSSTACDFGCGTVFKLAPSGEYTVLYAFKGRKNNDGEDPVGTLALDSQGNLYGATQWGGGGDCSRGNHGCGTIFKLTPDGQETVLHAFVDGIGGAFPTGVIRDGDGNLYGTTPSGGGRGNCLGQDCGTVFRLTPDGAIATLYAFAGGNDGGAPWAGLLEDADGHLYGTTQFGGTDCDGLGRGCGTVFKLAPGGRETILHRFGGDDGANPQSGLVQDATGTLYGATYGGGLDCYNVGEGCGTVFKVKN